MDILPKPLRGSAAKEKPAPGAGSDEIGRRVTVAPLGSACVSLEPAVDSSAACAARSSGPSRGHAADSGRISPREPVAAAPSMAARSGGSPPTTPAMGWCDKNGMAANIDLIMYGGKVRRELALAHLGERVCDPGWPLLRNLEPAFAHLGSSVHTWPN
jgi:hypothetical protein